MDLNRGGRGRPRSQRLLRRPLRARERPDRVGTRQHRHWPVRRVVRLALEVIVEKVAAHLCQLDE